MVYPTTLRSLQRTSRLLSDNLPSSPAASSSSSIYQRAASSLLPPLPLYRRLLRAHRTKLSYEMRSLGDTYLRDEFRRHRSVTNPLQVVGFLGGWKIYLDQLEGELDGGIAGATTGEGGNKRFFEGRKLSAEEFEKLSEEQLYQLHEFMTATQDLYDPKAPGPPGPPSADGSAETAEAAGRRSGAGEAKEGEGEKVIKDILESSSPEKRR